MDYARRRLVSGSFDHGSSIAAVAVTTSKFAPLPGYSRGEINRAGVELRRWWRSDEDIRPDVARAMTAMGSEHVYSRGRAGDHEAG